MSRTRHGKKAAGYEYWTRRPGNKHGGLLGAYTKHKTHKAERAQGRKQAKSEPV